MLSRSLFAVFVFTLAICHLSEAGKKSKKKSSKSYSKTLLARMGRYPGYSGELAVDGEARVTFDRDDVMMISLNVQGLEQNVAAGIHIHDGKSCETTDDPGKHYWNKNEFGPDPGDDPWDLFDGGIGTTYDTSSDGTTDSVIPNIDTGYGYKENSGRVVVMHKSDGTRIGCGVLFAETTTMRAYIDTYPDYDAPDGPNVKGYVDIKFIQDRSIKVSYQLDFKGVDQADIGTTGGLHVHTGTTCSSKDDVQGHWWADQRTKDLWFKKFGSVYKIQSVNDKGYGSAVGSFNLANGNSAGAYESRAVVIHIPGDGSTRIGCGTLMPVSGIIESTQATIQFKKSKAADANISTNGNSSLIA